MKTAFRTFAILIWTFSLTFQSFGQKSDSFPTPKTDREKLELFLKLTDTLRKKGNNPGLTMAIFNKGELIYKGGMGYRNLEEKLPVTTTTLFEIGSLTKAFTGVLASQLVQKRQMDWKDRVVEHYPDFKLSDEYATENATFLDLFTHRTGLAQHYYLQYGPKFSMKDIPEILPLLSFDGSFREKYLYNNLVYTMAGIVEGKISGRSWHEMIKENIFKPLGMENSFTSFEEFRRYHNRSVSYANDGKTIIPESSLDAVAPAGSITSTINDMSVWVEMLLHSGKTGETNFLSREELDFLMSPHAVKNREENIFYGIGWDVDTNRKIISHDGRTAGQSSRIVLMPGEGFGIVILCNQKTDLQNLLTRYAANIFVREKYERLTGFEEYIEQKAKPKQDSQAKVYSIRDKKIQAKLPNITGEYRHPAYGTIKLSLKEADTLIYEYYDFKGSVEYQGDNKFIAHTRHYTGKDQFPFKILFSKTAQVQGIQVSIPYSDYLIFTKAKN